MPYTDKILQIDEIRIGRLPEKFKKVYNARAVPIVVVNKKR